MLGIHRTRWPTCLLGARRAFNRPSMESPCGKSHPLSVWYTHSERLSNRLRPPRHYALETTSCQASRQYNCKELINSFQEGLPMYLLDRLSKRSSHFSSARGVPHRVFHKSCLPTFSRELSPICPLSLQSLAHLQLSLWIIACSHFLLLELTHCDLVARLDSRAGMVMRGGGIVRPNIRGLGLQGQCGLQGLWQLGMRPIGIE